jgi:hypothetical protein
MELRQTLPGNAISVSDEGAAQRLGDFYPACRNGNVQVGSSFPSSRAGGDAAQEINR